MTFAALVEVIEHLDPNRLEALEWVVFGCAQPSNVIITTPNVEYNVLFESMSAGQFRHRDHRFEWTRAEFESWAQSVASAHSYKVVFEPLGDVDPKLGAPSQLAHFFPMTLTVPELSLILLIGPSGAGKSTFARRHFKPTEVVSSDVCRGIVSDDENDQAVSGEAFALLDHIVETRLKLGKLTVVDATNVDPIFRKRLVAIARRYHCLPAAIVFKIPDSVCHARNQERPDRNFGAHVIRRQPLYPETRDEKAEVRRVP